MYTNNKIQMRVSKLNTHYITILNTHLIENVRSKPVLGDRDGPYKFCCQW